jgi:hypothetical protein
MMKEINLWVGPFGMTRISKETMIAYGCYWECQYFDAAMFIEGWYPNLQKLGQHIEIMQEYQWLRGGSLTVI